MQKILLKIWSRLSRQLLHKEEQNSCFVKTAWELYALASIFFKIEYILLLKELEKEAVLYGFLFVSERVGGSMYAEYIK